MSSSVAADQQKENAKIDQIQDAKIAKLEELSAKLEQDSISRQQKTESTFTKLQQYINQQTEFVNEGIKNQDDVLENFSQNLTQIMNKMAQFEQKGPVTAEISDAKINLVLLKVREQAVYIWYW